MWRRRQGSPYPPPPTPFHNILNLMHGQEKISKKFVSFPRLNLPRELTEDGRESATYHVDKGENHFVSS